MTKVQINICDMTGFLLSLFDPYMYGLQIEIAKVGQK